MEHFLQQFSLLITNKIFLTIAIVVVLQLLSKYIVVFIKRDNDILNEQHRTWISRTKNIKAMVMAIFLLSLWWGELQTFALSIAAVAVAIVIASKELILCLSGSILRATSNAFVIGDWIKVGDNHGEVIEHNILSTLIQEVDFANNTYNYTGRTAIIPNSQFLTETVKNMNFMKRYVYHTFSIHCDTKINMFDARDHIFQRMDKYTKEFLEIGQRYNSVIEKRLGVDLPGEEPYIRITTTELGNFKFTIILFCPTEQAVSLEQRITQDFMQFRYDRLDS
ncbi:mechanosensitive ion channel family protein [Thalassotalea sp. HSM 43]|uniref:mechanosensitive ion channel family protein n=1 Tax=Thalassotalea sp. HSM 43 TaxID=2552945 RepID=UPI001080D4DB|nr:mechanosensitive ion channel family protein [Thalassotalea sp. HSM 43]QBY03800.1 mechanosensitive ion channel family protein [Thalassotalea sp. HSM 43]